MGRIVSKAGELVVIGDIGQAGFPTRTTQGIPVVDAGIPLTQYAPAAVDPLAMWKKHPSLRKVITFAARQIASINWHVYEKLADGDRVRLTGSPAEAMLNGPSPFVTGYHFWHDLTVDCMMYDLWAFVILEDRLVRLPPNRLKITSDFLGQVVKIELRVDASTTASGFESDRDRWVDLTGAPLCIGWGWAPSAAGGTSPLQTLADILNESSSAVDWRRKQWEQSPKFMGYLARPAEAPKWDDTKRDRFLQGWRGWRDGSAQGTPLLEDGLEYKELPKGPSPKDAEDIRGRQLTDAEVASAYHIPPELVGAREGNYSNMQAYRQMLFGPTLGPQFKEFEQAVNQMALKAMGAGPGAYAELDREAAMNGSFMEQAITLSTAVGAPWLMPNEARSMFNRPAVEGGDQLRIPLNTVGGGGDQASPRDSGSQNRVPAPAKSAAMEGSTVQYAQIVGDTPTEGHDSGA